MCMVADGHAVRLHPLDRHVGNTSGHMLCIRDIPPDVNMTGKVVWKVSVQVGAGCQQRGVRGPCLSCGGCRSPGDGMFPLTELRVGGMSGGWGTGTPCLALP